MTRLLALALLVGCSTPSLPPSPTDAGPPPSDAVAYFDNHHFVVSAWTFGGEGIEIDLDGVVTRAEGITEARGPHTVTIRTRSGLVEDVEVRLFCNGVGIEGALNIPPQVSGTFRFAEQTWVWECP